jgi:hypothetical protein
MVARSSDVKRVRMTVVEGLPQDRAPMRPLPILWQPCLVRS